MTFTPIHHIVITVSDIKETEKFYGPFLESLGWSVRSKSKNFIEFVSAKDLNGSNFLLVFGEPRDVDQTSHPFNRNNIGLDHVAFQVGTRAELEKTANVLIAAGVKLEDGGVTDDDFGGTAIFCVDPDGMKVEVHLHSERRTT